MVLQVQLSKADWLFGSCYTYPLLLSTNTSIINCNTIDIPSKKPIFQKELMLLGHGYDCK